MYRFYNIMSELQDEQHARVRRCLIMAWALSKGEPCTRREWAKEFGVCAKTIQRDLGHIREALGWNIVYDARTTEYYLETE